MPLLVAGSTTPLAAGAAYNSGLLKLDIEAPNIAITVSADQNGTLSLLEFSQENTDSNYSLIVPVVGGQAPALITFQARQPFWAVQYVNGGTAQTSFSLSFVIGNALVSLSQQTTNWLILKELRAISMLIANLKEPTGSLVNINYGPDPLNLI